MHCDRGDALTGAGDRLDAFLAEIVPYEVVADRHELRRDEPDFITAAEEHRVLGREPQATVDRDESVVRANLDAGHRAAHRREHGLDPLA